MEDFQIIECLQRGDLKQIDSLYNKYSLQAVRTAYLITNDRQLAEDITQEAFIQAIKSIKGLKNPAAFKPWFYKILTRIALKQIKNKNNIILTDEIENQIITPVYDEYFQKEKYDKLYEAINKLDYKHKTTIILFYFNEMSIKEIAKAMGCLEGTVKSRLFTAKHKLKELIKMEVLQ